MKNFKPDVVHTNSMMTSAYALPIAKLFGVPLINGSIRNCFHNSTVRWRIERLLLCLSDFRIANSVAGLVSRGFSPGSPKDFVVHNGVDILRSESLESQEEGSQRSGADELVRVGMVAEFRPDKDFRSFLLAALRLIDSRPNVTFVTVGNGQTIDSMKELVSHVGSRVEFLGGQKEIEKLVSSFSIGVLATFTEGISNSIMEYMMMAKPVVATDCSGTRELVLDGKTGFLVPAEDPTALADKIAFLLDNPEEARRMGEAGRKRLVEHFSLELMIDKTMEIYKHAIRCSKFRKLGETTSQAWAKDA